MALQNVPTIINDIIQTNMLERKFWDQLESKKSYRGAAFRYPVEKRNGETMIYSRAGRITPVVTTLSPAANTGLDNGLTGIGGIGANNPTYPFEQFSVNIAEWAYSLDLNLVHAEEIIADMFKQNVINLAENCALSLDLIAAQALFRAYESGSTWATAAVADATAVPVDNTIGLDTAFATVTITAPGTGKTAKFPHGQANPVSAQNPLNVLIYPAAGGAPTANTVVAVAVDGVNTSSMQAGQVVNGTSGTLTLGTAATLSKGDIIVAADAPAYIRPNGKLSRYAMTTGDTNGIQLIINAVAQMRKNNIAPTADGTYVCFIDPTMEAQFYTDPQFQIMTQGEEQSPTFKNGRIARNFGVTFVPVTNAPVYTLANSAGDTIYTHRAIIMGERALMDCPFAGTFSAISRMSDAVADIRVVDDIVMVNRSPLDRFQQIMSQSWYWIGNFTVPTDATITPDVLPSATNARFKRAIVIEVAAAS